MKKTLLIVSGMLVFISCGASASDPSPTALTKAESVGTKERTYQGTYATTNKSISVNIDGAAYKGHYVSLADDATGSSSGVQAGSWGRAFLFASSAHILRCQLDAGFPKVSGQCRDSGGRNFQLKPAAAQQTIAAP